MGYRNRRFSRSSSRKWNT